MTRQYKAFISYRHKPLDMEIAKKLHKRIERFVIPKNKRINGDKKLGLVFRDQDELPIASDLSSNIRMALDNSEFLIVICTPDVVESRWCAAEISYFLEHHDRDHVLAVLVSGTPETSFPPQLTEIRDENNELINRVEPLAANIVADSPRKRNRLFQTESLRILAALLSCPYDDLYRREQRYKTRRLLAAMAAVVLIVSVYIGILVNRNAEIKRNYENVLRNQSSYLASESMKAYEEGDTLKAIALAIEALPSEDNPRPLISKAQYALTVATDAYIDTKPMSLRFPMTSTILPQQANGILKHDDRINDFIINNDRDLLCSSTWSNCFTLWNTKTMQKIWEYQFDGWDTDIFCFYKDQILLSQNKKTVSLNVNDGSVKWEKQWDDFTESSWYHSNACFSSCDGIIAATVYKKDDENIEYRCYLLNADNGEVISYFKLPETAVYVNDMTFSSDGSKIVYIDYHNYTRYELTVLNAEDGSVIYTYEADEKNRLFSSLGFIGENGLVFVEGSKDITNNNGKGSYSYKRDYYWHMMNNTLFVRKANLSTGKIEWTSICEYTQPGSRQIISYEEELTDKPILLYAFSNHLNMMDPQTGEVIHSFEYSSQIVEMKVLHEDRSIRLICMDGKEGWIDIDNIVGSDMTKVYDANIDKANYSKDDIWINVFMSSNLIHYGYMKDDPSMELLKIDTSYISPSFMDSLVSGTMIALKDSYNKVFICDLEKDREFRTVLLPENAPPSVSGYSASYKYEFGRYHDGALTMTWYGGGINGLLHLNVASLEYQMLELPEENRYYSDIYAWDAEEYYVAAGCDQEFDENMEKCFYLDVFDDNLTLVKSIEIGKFIYQRYFSKVIRIGNDQFYVVLGTFSDDGCFTYLVNARSNKVTECSSQLNDVISENPYSLDIIAAHNGKKIAFFPSEDELSVYDIMGNKLYAILPVSSTGIKAAHFSPDDKYILVVEGDNYYRMYSSDTGELISVSEYQSEGSVYKYETYWIDTDEGFIMLVAGDGMNLISTDDYEVFTYVPGGFQYVEDKDFFVCGTAYRDDIYGFKRRSLETLIEYGKEKLKGWDLSDEEKMEYGLD